MKNLVPALLVSASAAYAAAPADATRISCARARPNYHAIAAQDGAARAPAR